MVTKLLKYWLTLLLLINLLFAANSQTKPAKIWASVHFNKKEVMVGEPLVVTMTVYTSTWFTNPPDFDESSSFIDIPGTVTFLINVMDLHFQVHVNVYLA